MRTNFWYQEAHDSASNNSPRIGCQFYYKHKLIFYANVGIGKVEITLLWFAFGFTIGFSHHAFFQHLLDDRD